MKEDYAECNFDEVEYAFRNYGTNIEDWGKEVNLKLIDTVMNAYLSHRRIISQAEEYLVKPILKSIPTDEQVLSMKRETIEMKYQDFLKGKSSFVMQPPDGVATLALDGFCDFDVYEDFLDKALHIKKSELKNSLNEAKMNQKKALAEKLSLEIELLKTDDDLVIILAKKMALVYCFYKFKEAGYKNIYTK